MNILLPPFRCDPGGADLLSSVSCVGLSCSVTDMCAHFFAEEMFLGLQTRSALAGEQLSIVYKFFIGCNTNVSRLFRNGPE